jgi:hypothetical protein
VLDTIRKSFFMIALVFIGLAVLVEIGSIAKLGVVGTGAAGLNVPTPGKGILSLAFLDGLVLYTTILIGLALIVPERIQGRVQGLATLIFSVLVLIADIVMILAALALLILMVTLLLAPIFGTIAYFAIYGSFHTDNARTALSLIMTLKLVFAVCLIVAHQRFLQNKGLVLLVLTSLLATFIVSFLLGFVPGFLAAITDDIGAIIVGILAAIWAIVFLVGSVVSVVKAVT